MLHSFSFSTQKLCFILLLSKGQQDITTHGALNFLVSFSCPRNPHLVPPGCSCGQRGRAGGRLLLAQLCRTTSPVTAAGEKGNCVRSLRFQRLFELDTGKAGRISADAVEFWRGRGLQTGSGEHPRQALLANLRAGIWEGLGCS